ncbi:MAG: hypothetical protein J3K34DRAFT_32844 [Monoraphidium minutum]|nr:MAG: hypothetical protein J3K34DRAFT_32844 [Monoraphidium minutum]
MRSRGQWLGVAGVARLLRPGARDLKQFQTRCLPVRKPLTAPLTIPALLSSIISREFALSRLNAAPSPTTTDLTRPDPMARVSLVVAALVVLVALPVGCQARRAALQAPAPAADPLAALGQAITQTVGTIANAINATLPNVTLPANATDLLAPLLNATAAPNATAPALAMPNATTIANDVRSAMAGLTGFIGNMTAGLNGTNVTAMPALAAPAPAAAPVVTSGAAAARAAAACAAAAAAAALLLA